MCSNLDCEFGCTVFLAEECLRQLCAEYHSGICTGTKCARHFGHISFSSTSPTLCERPASSPGRDHLLKSRPQFDISTSTWSQAPAAEEQKERESSAYCITGFGSESWPIRVSFQQLGGKGTEALIEIKAFGQWTEFRNWLRTVFMRRYSFYSHKLLEELVDVWATNGRSFALLSLPLELRQQIYLCALGHTISPQLKWGQGNQTLALGTGKHYSHRPLGKEALSGHVRPDDPDIEKPNTNLLLVSKQIYSEVLETGWELTYKRFGENFRIFGQLLVTKMKMLLPPHALSKIQFDLNNDDYMKLIGFDTSCLSHRWYQMMQYKGTFPHLSILQNIPSLREVDFRFMSPHNVEAVDAFVDWFFTFALEYLRRCQQIKRISLSGSVKNSVRAKWETILAEEIRGIRHDMTQVIAAIEAQSRNRYSWNIVDCHCSMPCARSDEGWWWQYGSIETYCNGPWGHGVEEHPWKVDDFYRTFSFED